MATYKVQAPDGSIIELEGPDNATDAQLIQAAQAAYAQRQQRAQAAPAPAAAAPAPVAAPMAAPVAAPVAAPAALAPAPAPAAAPRVARPAPAAVAAPAPMAAPAPTAPAVPAPAAAAAQPKPMGFFEGLVESVTGRARATPETQSLPEWTSMPELSQMSMASFKSALGTLLTNPQETVQIMQANFPGLQARQDAKGNYILRSSVNQKEYAIPPGASVGDIPRILGGLFAFTPAGRAATIPGAVAKAGATQAGIELTQSGLPPNTYLGMVGDPGLLNVGGSFDLGEVGMAAATGPVGQIAQRVAPPVAAAVRRGVQRVTGRAPSPSAAPRVEPTFEAPPPGAFPEPSVEQQIAGLQYRQQLLASEPLQEGETRFLREVSINDLQRQIDQLRAPPVAPAAAPAAAAIPEAPPPAPGPAGAPMGTAMAPEVPPAAPGAAAAVPAGDVGEVLNLARKAAGMGPGSTAAKAKLVDMAQVNPDARAAAERLGIDVPFDVLSDNPQVRSAVGLTRALVAGEAEAAWENTLRQSVQRADEISQQFDAAFAAGRPSTGSTSQKILDNLQQTRQTLKSDAKAIYDRIEEVVPPDSPVDLNNLKTYLDELRKKLGPAGRLTPQEANLANMLEKGELTYFGFMREKNAVGQALEGGKSTYENMTKGALKNLYGALAKDQLDNVALLAGEEARRELRAANLLTAKQKALEKRIVGAFGQEIDGSVAQRMQTAISTAAKGDAAAFNRLMKVVPAELQKETLATALASVTAGKAAGRAAAGAAETVFSPAEFTKVYRGLRANPPVYSQMVKIMGPEWDRASRDLYEISRRIADADARIPTTGKANQILGQAAVESLMGKVMSSSLAQRAATGVAGLVPGGGVIAPDIVQWMSAAKGAGVQKAAKLFASPEFQELAVQSATKGGEPTQAAIRRTAMSKAFSDFAKEANLPQSLDARVQYLQSAIQAGRQFEQENE